MFEKYLASALVNVLGEYVDNLSSENLKLSIWAGEGSLGDVWLKKNALDGMDLPVMVGRGLLRSLKFKIPWHALQSQPCVCTIDELVLVVVPRSREEWNSASEAEREFRVKERFLSIFENSRKKDVSAQNETDQASPGYVARLTEVIANNILITINKVLIRVEGEGSTVGVVIDTLSAYTTNDVGDKQFVSPTPEQKYIFKVAELGGFRIFTDMNRDVPTDSNPDVWAKKMWKDVEGSPTVLGPVSAMCSAQITKSNAKLDFTVPNKLISLQIPDINAVVSKNQFSEFLHLAAWWTSWETVARFRRYRPFQIRPKRGQGCQKWWKFVIRSVLLVIKEQRRLSVETEVASPFIETMDTMYQLEFEKRVRTNGPSTRQIEHLERVLPLTTLIKARTEVYKRIQADLKALAQIPKAAPRKQTWGEWITGKTPKDEAMTLEDIAKAWGIDPNDTTPAVPAVEIPKSYIWTLFSFSLGRLGLTAQTEVGSCTLAISQIAAAYQSYNAPGSMHAECSVGNIVCNNPYSTEEAVALISRAPSSKEDALINFVFDKSPPNDDVDVVCNVTVLPLRIAFDPQTMKLYNNFVATERNVFIQNLASNASSKMNELTSAARDSVSYAVESAMNMRIAVELSSPEFLLSEDLCSKNASGMLISLGKLGLTSVPVTKEEKARRLALPPSDGDDDLKVYYEYKVILTKMLVEVYVPSAKSVQLLQPIVINGSLYTLLNPSDEKHYATQFRGNIKTITVDATLPAVYSMMKVVDSFSHTAVVEPLSPQVQTDAQFDLTQKLNDYVEANVEASTAVAVAPAPSRKALLALIDLTQIRLALRSTDTDEIRDFETTETHIRLTQTDKTVVDVSIQKGTIRDNHQKDVLALVHAKVYVEMSDSFLLVFESESLTGTIGIDLMVFVELIWDFLQLVTSPEPTSATAIEPPKDKLDTAVASRIAVIVRSVSIKGKTALAYGAPETSYIGIDLTQLDLAFETLKNSTMMLSCKVEHACIEDMRSVKRTKKFDRILEAGQLDVKFSNVFDKFFVPSELLKDSKLSYTNILEIYVPKSTIVYDQVTIFDILAYVTSGYLSRLSAVASRQRYDGKSFPVAHAGPRVLTKLKIKLDHPHVLLAPTLESPNYFESDLGQIQIENNFVYLEEWNDNIKIAFHDFEIKSGQRQVVQKAQLTLDVVQPILAAPKFKLAISSPNLHFHCDEPSYLLLLSLVGDNILKPAPKQPQYTATIETSTPAASTSDVVVVGPAQTVIDVSIDKIHFGIQSYNLELTKFQLIMKNIGQTRHLTTAISDLVVGETNFSIIVAQALHVGYNLEDVAGVQTTTIDVGLSVNRFALSNNWLVLHDQLYNAKTVVASRGIFGGGAPPSEDVAVVVAPQVPPYLMKVAISLPATNLDFHHGGRSNLHFASGTFSSLAVSVEMSPSQMSVNVDVGNVVLKQIIDNVTLVDFPTSTSSSLLHCEYTATSTNRKVAVRLAQLRIQYVRSLFDELIFFFVDTSEPVQRVSLIGNTKESRTKATGPSIFMELDVSWDSPIILVPSVTAGIDPMKCNLGKLRVSNSTNEKSDVYHVNLEGLDIEGLLEPVKLDLNYGVEKGTGFTSIEIGFAKTKAIYSEAGMYKLREVLASNINQGWKRPEFDPLEHTTSTIVTVDDQPKPYRMSLKLLIEEIDLLFRTPFENVGILRLQNLNLVMDQTATTMVVDARMKSLSLHDDENHSILSSGGDHALVVKYEAGPEHSSVEADINSMHLVFLPISIGKLIRIVLVSGGTGGKSSAEQKSDEIAPSPSPITNRQTYRISLTSFELTFVESEHKPICYTYQQKSLIQYSMSSSGESTLQCDVGAVLVTDKLEVNSLYPKIVELGSNDVSSENSHFANVTYKTWKRKNPVKVAEVTSKLEMVVRKSTVVVLPSVIFAILSSVQNAMKQFASVTNPETTPLSTTKVDKKKSTNDVVFDRMEIIGNFEAPEIIIPLNVRSKDNLVISLGKSSIRTQFVPHEKSPYETMAVSVEHVHLKALGEDILKPMSSAYVEFKTSLNPAEPSVSHVNIPDIELNINHDQYILILRIAATFAAKAVEDNAVMDLSATTAEMSRTMSGTYIEPQSSQPSVQTAPSSPEMKVTCGQVIIKFVEKEGVWLTFTTQQILFHSSSQDGVQTQKISLGMLSCFFGEKAILSRKEGTEGNILQVDINNVPSEASDTSIRVNSLILLLDAVLAVKVVNSIYTPYLEEYQGYKQTYTCAIPFKDQEMKLQEDLIIHSDQGMRIFAERTIFHVLDLQGHTLTIARRSFDGKRAVIVVDSHCVLRIINGIIELPPLTSVEDFCCMGEGSILDIDILTVKFIHVLSTPASPSAPVILAQRNTLRLRADLQVKTIDQAGRAVSCELKTDFSRTTKVIDGSTKSVTDLSVFYEGDSDKVLQPAEFRINIQDSVMSFETQPIVIAFQGYHIGLLQEKMAILSKIQESQVDVYNVTAKLVKAMFCDNGHPLVCWGQRENFMCAFGVGCGLTSAQTGLCYCCPTCRYDVCVSCAKYKSYKPITTNAIHVVIPNILFTLSDDISDLLRIYMNSMKVDITPDEAAYKNVGSLQTLTVEHYSRTHLAWEPLIEDCVQLIWAVESTPESTKCQITFPNRLDIIATSTAIKTLSSLGSIRTNAEKPRKRVVVVNRTSDLLKVNRGEENLQPGERKVVTCDELLVEDSSGVMVSVGLNNVGYFTRQQFLFKVMGRDGEILVGVNHHVWYDKRLFCVRLVNHCRTPLYLDGFTLNPNPEDWITLGHGFDLRSTLNVNVLHDQYSWSPGSPSSARELTLYSDMLRHGNTRLIFQGQNQSTPTLHMKVAYFPREKVADVECIEVFFTSYYDIRNKIPLPLKVDLMYNDRVVPSLVNNTLGFGFSLPCLTLDPTRKVFAAVSIDGAEEGIKYSCASTELKNTVELVSAKGKSVLLYVDESSSGCTFYVPFTILNHTHLNLQFLTSKDNKEFAAPPLSTAPVIPYCPSENELTCRLRVPGGEWSPREYFFHAISGTVTVPLLTPTSEWVHVSCYTELSGQGPHRIIHFTPKWVLINRCSFPLTAARDDGVEVCRSTNLNLIPNTAIHFYNAKGEQEKTKLCIAESRAKMTPRTGLDVDTLGEVTFSIGDGAHYIGLSVVPNMGINYVQMHENLVAPYLLINWTPFSVDVGQQASGIRDTCGAFAICPFGFPEPYGASKIVISIRNSDRMSIVIPTNTTTPGFCQIPDFVEKPLFHMVSYNSHNQVVITICTEIESWIHRTKSSLEHSAREEVLCVSVNSFSVSVVSEPSCEVLVLQTDDLIAKVTRTGDTEVVMFSVQKIQIDNETEGSPPFPVILAPQVNNATPLFISWEKSIETKSNSASRFKSFHFSVEPLAIRVGDVVLSKVMGFVTEVSEALGSVQKEPTHGIDSEELVQNAPLSTGVMKTMLEFENFDISPLVTRIWFQRQRGEHDILKGTSYSGLVGSIDDFPFSIEGIKLLKFRDRATFFFARLKEVYIKTINNNLTLILYNYVKTMPLVGAPLQVFSALKDAASSSISDPEASPLHVAQMTASVAGGVLGTVSSLTGGIASVANKLSDKEAPRSVAQKRYIPGQNLLKGFVHGVSDVISKPSLGNVVGIVTKPVAGVIQEVSAATGSLAKTLSNDKIVECKRRRWPRIFGETGAVLSMSNIVVCIQNERRYPGGWSSELLLGDPPSWTDGSGHKRDRVQLEQQALERGCVLSTWKCEEIGRGPDGWMYAEDFNHDFHPKESSADVVRRRFWYAERVLSRKIKTTKHVDPEAAPPPPPPQNTKPKVTTPTTPPAQEASQSVTVEVYENQRDFKIFGFGKHLLPTDRSKFSNKEGTRALTKEGVVLPQGWTWDGDWYVEGPDEGWEYALDFTATFHPKKGALDCVRRRCWKRKMKK